jgi:hypothetical protein
MKRKLPERQADLAEAMRILDHNLFADTVQVRSCLDSLDENGLRPFNYDYYFMNLLAIFGNSRKQDEIREMAIACNKFRLWSRWECYSEPFRSGAAELCLSGQSRLQGWVPSGIASLLALRRGLVVYTSHYGAFRRIYWDLALMGLEPWISVDADSAAGFRQRASCAVEHLGNHENVPQISQIERVINVEDPLAAVRIAGLLKKNEVVIVFADGNGGVDGPWGQSNKMCIQFLGYPIAVKCGIVKVAAAVGSPILPVFTRRTAALHQAAVPLSVVGEVQCKPAIIPQPYFSDNERAGFARDCVETMFGYFQQAVLEDPTQWESACLFHRWRGVHKKKTKDTEETTSMAAVQARCPLIDGVSYRLNEDCVARIPTDEGTMLVNVRSLRVFRVKKELEELAAALGSAQGVGRDWCIAHRCSAETSCNVTSFLTAFQQLGLLHKS